MTQTSSTAPAFAHFDLPGGCRLAINANKKMKTVSVLASFLGNLDDTITEKALLPSVLRRGTRVHPDMKSLNRHLEGLYGTVVAGSVQKLGEWHAVRFRLDVVNERFVPQEEGLLRRGLESLREVLKDPLCSAGAFQADFVAQEKENLRRSIESLVDHKAAYAHFRMFEEMCAHEPFRLHEHGCLDAIPAVTPESLWGCYESCLETLPLHVYVAGDVNVAETRELVSTVLLRDFQARPADYPLSPPPNPQPVGAPRVVKEHLGLNQAKLVLGFRHGVTYADEAYEALLVMNGVLGGFSHSKLFQNVREKASMAYSVNSGAERSKGLLVISAGIAAENYEAANEIILEQIRAVQQGDVTTDELEATISTLLNHNEMLEDNLPLLGEVDFIWGLHGRRLDLDAFRNRLRAVDKDAVVESASRLVHDTTYLLT
jgi:predicted Zn-dependent peptidase